MAPPRYYESIYDDVGWVMSGEYEHLLQALRQNAIARLLRATAMFRKQAEKYVKTGIRPSRKLREERKEQVPAGLFIGDPEVKIK